MDACRRDFAKIGEGRIARSAPACRAGVSPNPTPLDGIARIAGLSFPFAIGAGVGVGRQYQEKTTAQVGAFIPCPSRRPPLRVGCPLKQGCPAWIP